MLLSDSLVDPLSSVHLVERRLLVAGLIGLAFALVVGYGAAAMHARRIRRLERAVERIAAGRFDEPVVDAGRDELGELAAAVERMRERLENLDRASREFIANASHELRTPLFSLGGFLELMADEDLDEATRQEFLETMREQVARLAKLATDLLDLSRLDAGRMRIEHAPVDLGNVAQLLEEEFRALADAQRPPARGDRRGPADRASRDELRVLQIGRALVDNALVHSPAGTRGRSLRARADREHAYLEVEDEGPGVAAGARAARVRALLPRRRRPGLRQRARARDRPRARDRDGRRGDARLAAGADGRPRRARRGADVGSRLGRAVAVFT